MFVFVVSKTGISAQCISDITGVSYKSVKLMLRKIKADQKENNDKYPVKWTLFFLVAKKQEKEA